MLEFLNWLLDLPWWAWAVGVIAWLTIAFLLANSFGEIQNLGGRRDIRYRRRWDAETDEKRDSG